MEKRTVAIIITVAAVLLCACPGITGVFGGILMALISFIPGADIDIMGSSSPRAALNTGIITLVIGVVFCIIAGVAIYLAWKKKKA